MVEVIDGLSFGDVLCVPRLSRLIDRSDVDTKVDIGSLRLNIPIMSAPMDTVTGIDMAIFMHDKGGLGIIHRYCSIEDQVRMVETVKQEQASVGAAVGVNGDASDRAAALVDAGADLLCIDVAHGHTMAALSLMEHLSKYDVIKVSGNICTSDAAADYISAGTDILRVGIGGGSSCTTRLVAGVGVPQVTAIMDVAEVAYGTGVKVVADGGIRNSGDIVKAIVAGADAVMLGGLLAAYQVSAAPVVLVNTGKRSNLGDIIKLWKDASGSDSEDVLTKGVVELDLGNEVVKKKLFRGMASASAFADRGIESALVEGESFFIDIDYDFDRSFDSLVRGLRAGLAYLGVKSIAEAKHCTKFVRVSASGRAESIAHIGDTPGAIKVDI